MDLPPSAPYILMANPPYPPVLISPTIIVFPGVKIPAGLSKIVYTYQPQCLALGLTLWAIGITGLAVIGYLIFRERRPASDPQNT